MKDATYYPVWIDSDGTEWIEESLWEQCEFGHGTFDPDNVSRLKAGEPQLREPSENDCLNHVEFVGQKGDIRIQLCGAHFAEIKSRCRVRWDEFAA